MVVSAHDEGIGLMKKNDTVKLVVAIVGLAAAGAIFAWQFLAPKPVEEPVQPDAPRTTGIPDASGKDVPSGRSGSVYTVPQKDNK